MVQRLYATGQPQSLVRLEQDLAKKGLTLKEAEELEKKAFFLEGKDKTQQVAVQNFFAQLYDKMEGLAGREVERLEAEEGILSKIEKLGIERRFFLSPDEVLEKIGTLEERASLEEDPKVREIALRALGELKVSRDYPTLAELKEYSERVERIGKEVLKRNSLAFALKNLSPTQIHKIAEGA